MILPLQKKDPELWFYLKKHKMLALFECILSGLLVECPEDPKVFIIEKVKTLQQQGIDVKLIWDMFISEENKPKESMIKSSWLDSIFDLDFEEDNQPTPEMYYTAYTFYNMQLTVKALKGWILYHNNKKEKKLELDNRYRKARRWHRKRVKRQLLLKWHKWMRIRSTTHEVAYQRVKRMYQESLSKRVLLAWRNIIVEARRTKEYFAKIERGELNPADEKQKSSRSPSVRSPSKKDQNQDELSLLPRALAIKIFSYLNPLDLARCAQVCRNWKVITQANQLWNRIDVSHKSIVKKINGKVLQKILHKARPYLGHLNIRGCRDVGMDALRIIGECRNLQDLNLSDCYYYNDELMHYIGTGCKILLYLNLSQCDFSDATLRSLSRFCTNLQFLSMAYVNTFSVKGLQYLAAGKGCHKLSYLDVSGCTQINTDGMKHIADCCPFLNTIILNDLSSLKDEAIMQLVNGCRNLKAISLQGTNSLSDHSFQYISQLKKLRKIRVEGNNLITDVAVKALGRSCFELNHIYLVDCPRLTDLAIKALAPCRQLNYLNIADCVRISDTGVRHVVEGQAASKLRELNLSNCIRISDVTLLRIAQKCTELQHASFCFCEHVTDAGAELMGGLPNLVTLDLSGCFIQDQGLMALGNNGKFRDIGLAECSTISDFGIQRMCQHCRDILYLDLSHCVLITDNAVKSIAFCCRLIKSLKLGGCSQLTDTSAQYISGVLKHLEELDMSACSHITDKSLRYIRKGCKNLKKLTLLYCRSITKSAISKVQALGVEVIYSTADASTFLSSKNDR